VFKDGASIRRPGSSSQKLNAVGTHLRSDGASFSTIKSKPFARLDMAIQGWSCVYATLASSAAAFGVEYACVELQL
jgi:hypothetical protein